MSNSWIETPGAYLAERLPPTRFIPLSLMLVLASLVDRPQPDLIQLLLEAVLMLALLFQFRLWDDLHDRALDLQLHPDRVLSRTQTPQVFRWLAAVMCLVNLSATALLLSPTAALSLLLPLDACLFLWYRARTGNRLLHAHVVLLKYPALVLLLSGRTGTFSAETGIALVLVYLSFVVHELLHDSALFTMPGGARLMKIEATSLAAAAWTLAGWTACQYQAALALLLAALAGIGLTGLLILFRFRRSLAETARVDAIFVPLILQLLTLILLPKP